MPFGLKNPPSVFQRAIINALGNLAYSYVIVYMDDIMVVSSTIDLGMERLRMLDVLTAAGFSFNIAKLWILKNYCTILGV